MRKILIALLLFSSPAYSQITEESVEKLGNKLLLDCKEYGIESCASRVIALSACTYAFSVNQGTEPEKAQEISDALFSSLVKTNKIPFDSLFNPDDSMKESIKRESLERISKCKSAIKKAIPIIYEAFNGKPLEKERTEEMTNVYPFWYIDDMERMKKKYF